MQTLRAGCSKAEPKNFRPAADLLPGGTGQPKFNQLEMVTTFTYIQRFNAILLHDSFEAADHMG